MILGRKYGRIWKRVAWQSGLLRKGIHRRKIFAKSLHDLAQNVHQRPLGPISSTSKASDIQPNGSRNEASVIMRREHKASEGKSLPASLTDQNPTKAGFEISINKRKRRDYSTLNAISPPNYGRPQHERSLIKDPQTRLKDNEEVERPEKDLNSRANLRDMNLADESNVRRPRSLRAGRTDTTRTDYFRLKALGVDPDTPIVPQTVRKRLLTDVDRAGRKRTKLSPAHKGSSPSPRDEGMQDGGFVAEMVSPLTQSTDVAHDNSDEALLAQMQVLRDTMADSMSFFRAERSKTLLMDSHVEDRAPKDTAKHRNLREFATTTTSRTEQRLRRTGAHGLLPKGWDPRSSWRDESGQITTNPASSGSDLAAGDDFPPTDAYPTHLGFDGAAVCGETKKAKDLRDRTATRAAGSSAEHAIEL